MKKSEVSIDEFEILSTLALFALFFAALFGMLVQSEGERLLWGIACIATLALKHWTAATLHMLGALGVLLVFVSAQGFTVNLFVCILAFYATWKGMPKVALAYVFVTAFLPLELLVVKSDLVLSPVYISDPVMRMGEILISGLFVWFLAFAIRVNAERGNRRKLAESNEVKSFLHDEIGNSLATASLGIQLAMQNRSLDDALLAGVHRDIDSALEAVKKFATDRKRSKRTIEGLLDEVTRKAALRGLKTRIRYSGVIAGARNFDVFLSAMEEICINAIKHSPSHDEIDIALNFGDGVLNCRVENQLELARGIGAGRLGMGLGLVLLGARVRARNGTLSYGAAKDKWVAEVWLPNCEREDAR